MLNVQCCCGQQRHLKPRRSWVLSGVTELNQWTCSFPSSLVPQHKLNNGLRLRSFFFFFFHLSDAQSALQSLSVTQSCKHLHTQKGDAVKSIGSQLGFSVLVQGHLDTCGQTEAGLQPPVDLSCLTKFWPEQKLFELHLHITTIYWPTAVFHWNSCNNNFLYTKEKK